MSETLCFQTRNDFRKWLLLNSQTSEGIWLVFSKNNKQETLTPNEALEEALCFGWIDGLMKKIDDCSYIKYFALRKKNSKWSKRNKEIVITLEEQGLMTNFGRVKIAEAKANGQWDNARKPSDITDDEIDIIRQLIIENQLAYTNFMNMSLSVRKTYTRAYLDAKTDAGKLKRLDWIIERLEKNLKPM